MTAPYWQDETCTLRLGDALEVLREMPAATVDCCVTSPPYYGLRDYGTEGQIGLEDSPARYVERLREVFAEVRRVLASDGTLWLNIGDSYSGSWGNQGRKPERGTQRQVNGPMLQPVHDDRYPSSGSGTGTVRPGEPPAKNLLMIPERLVLALQDDGWIVRNKGVWHKPGTMPHPVADRLTGRWEPLYLLARSPRYYFDLDAIRVPHSPVSIARSGRNRFATDRSQEGAGSPDTLDPSQSCHQAGANPGDVWTIANSPYSEAHFATFPVQLPIRCIKTTRPGATVLDPFSGAGTTGEACRRLGRKYVGIDINRDYHDLAIKRYAQGVLMGGA